MFDRSAINIAIRPALSSVENPFTARFAASITAAGYRVVELSWQPWSLIEDDFVILHWPDEFFVTESIGRQIKALIKLGLLKLGKWWRGTRLIWVAHNAQPHDQARKRSLLTAAFFRNLDGIIFLSQHSCEVVRQLHPASAAIPSLLTMHGHYRDDASTPPRAPPPLDDGVYLGYFGQIKPYKNVVELIARSREMSASRVTLSVVGRCQDRDLTRQILAVASQAPRVRLDVRTTLLPDVELEEAIDSCHGIVLPYRYILNSGAVLLALSRNRPVLAPRIGGLPELQATVGPKWLQLYDGMLTGRVLDDFSHFLRTRRPSADADLSAYDWQTVGRSLVRFIDQLAFGQAVTDEVAQHGS